MNLLTPERTLRAIGEVKAGISFCLSLPLDYPGGAVLNPRRKPPVLEPTTSPETGAPRYNYPLRLDDPRHIDVGCDDRVHLTLQYSTQWDAFCHMGQLFDADDDGIPEIRYYNGFQGGVDIIGPVDYGAARGEETPRPEGTGARRLGIENMAVKGLVGRGVMVNLAAHFGRERKLVGYDDLMRVLGADKVVVEEGDLVCFYTGFADVILEMKKQPDGPTLARSCAVLERARRQAAAVGHRQRRRLPDLRQLRRRAIAGPAGQGRALRQLAAAPALPVQARRAARRDLVSERVGRLAEGERTVPILHDGAAAAAAGSSGLAGQCGGAGLTIARGRLLAAAA